jgi:hypothetical protein
MAFTTYTSATDLVLCQFRVDPDPSQTYAHALSAGVIFEAYGSRPPDGTYWADVGIAPARDTYLDFANGELSAAGAPYAYANRYGGKIFQVSGDTEPIYIGKIEFNSSDDESFAILPSGQLLGRGNFAPLTVTSAHRADRAYILPSGQDLSALTFSFGAGSSYANLYLCVDDDDDTLLASTIDHETRTGVNDILLYSVSASPASTTIPLTGFSNAEAGQEIILKAVFNYTTSATQPPYLSLEELLHYATWYSGYKNRSTWYAIGNWQAVAGSWKGYANISATSAIAYNNVPPTGIAHFMIKDDGSFLFENWTAGEYNDFAGAITTPVLDFTSAAEEITCVHAPAITIFVTQPVAQENQSVLVQTSITNGESATSYDWDWGDGNFTLSGNANEEHVWTGMTDPTSYTISVTAHGAICGTGSATASIDIWPTLTTATTTDCVLSADYIELCGQAVARFGACRQIDLTSFLPDYVREHDTLQFTQFFEDFLNTLYAGACGVTISTSAYSEASGTSGAATTADINVDEYTYTEPTITSTTDSCNLCSAWDQTRTISILEKIFRLTETHDPELIDLEFIQFFASNLGYDVSVNRQEMGNLGESTSGECSENNSEKYLRFMVENLPNWYKIKTTQNAIKVMLFSFGLIGDILNYYTRNYKTDWRLSRPEYYTSGTGEPVMREKLDTIPDNWYPTPHFAIWFDVRRSSTNFSFNTEKQNAIIRAIDSIRPLNTVFEGVQAYLDGVVHSYARGISRVRKYIRVPDGDNRADWYGWVNPL